MNKFDDTYNTIASSFFDTEAAKNWPKDLPWPNVETKGLKLILEDKHRKVNIGQAALGYLKSLLKEDVIVELDYDVLKEKLLYSWKHYDDFCICCKGKKIYLLKTDFNDHKKAERLIKNKFNVKLDLAGAMTGTAGLAGQIEEGRTFIIILHTDAPERKLQHEFIHCVQFITGKIMDSIDGLPEEVKKHFKIAPEYENYVFNKYEFWANIYNELFNDLQKVYWLHYKQISWEKYMDAVSYTLKNDKVNYRQSLLGIHWGNDDCNFLFLDIIACIAYVKPEFFDEIMEKLKNRE